MTVTSLTETGLSTRLRRGSDASRAVARQAPDRNATGSPLAPEIATPWRLPLAMVGMNVVLVVWCLVLGAGIAAAVCAMCAGYLAAVCRDARPERSNRGGGDLR